MTAARTTTSPTVTLMPARRSKKLLWAVVAVMVTAIATIAVTLVLLSGRSSPASGPANPPIRTVQNHNQSDNGAHGADCLPSRVIHYC